MGELKRQRRGRWRFPLSLPQMAAPLAEPKIALVFYLVLLSAHQAYCQSTGKLVFNPSNKLLLDPRLKHFVGKVTVTCDGSQNSKPLSDLFLAKSKDQTEADVEEILQDRGPTSQKDANQTNFEGSVTSKTLSYTLENPACERDGTTFKCTVQQQNDPSPYVEEGSLELTVSDSEVVLSPESLPSAVRTVADHITITCSAVIGGITENTTERVTWSWMELAEGELSYQDLDDEHIVNIHTLKPKPEPCRGVNSTSIFSLTLQPTDNRKKYRCAYKNPTAANPTFNFNTAKTFSVGTVKLLDYGTEEPPKTVYTMTSLIGMILGVITFLLVSCMGLLYVYRKTRSGKKYDIETALLKEEEDKLLMMETKLGLVKSETVAKPESKTAHEQESESELQSEDASTAASEEPSVVSHTVDDNPTTTAEEEASAAESTD